MSFLKTSKVSEVQSVGTDLKVYFTDICPVLFFYYPAKTLKENTELSFLNTMLSKASITLVKTIPLSPRLTLT